jgi:hypothetical protein
MLRSTSGRLGVTFRRNGLRLLFVAGFATMVDYFVVAAGFITAGHYHHHRLELGVCRKQHRLRLNSQVLIYILYFTFL